MNTYQIKVTMEDGTQGLCYGLFSDGFAAVMGILEEYPGARRISARRLP